MSKFFSMTHEEAISISYKYALIRLHSGEISLAKGDTIATASDKCLKEIQAYPVTKIFLNACTIAVEKYSTQEQRDLLLNLMVEFHEKAGSEGATREAIKKEIDTLNDPQVIDMLFKTMCVYAFDEYKELNNE